MKKFKFKLEKILKYRMQIAKEFKMQVVEAHRLVRIKEKDFEEAVLEKKTLLEKRNLYASQNLNIKMLKNYAGYFKVMDRRIEYYKRELENAEENLENKKQLYIKAIQDQRALERLKEKAKLEYDYELMKDEEKIVDSIVSFSNKN